jgi:hypothetical protein
MPNSLVQGSTLLSAGIYPQQTVSYRSITVSWQTVSQEGGKHAQYARRSIGARRFAGYRSGQGETFKHRLYCPDHIRLQSARRRFAEAFAGGV